MKAIRSYLFGLGRAHSAVAGPALIFEPLEPRCLLSVAGPAVDLSGQPPIAFTTVIVTPPSAPSPPDQPPTTTAVVTGVGTPSQVVAGLNNNSTYVGLVYGVIPPEEFVGLHAIVRWDDGTTTGCDFGQPSVGVLQLRSGVPADFTTPGTHTGVVTFWQTVSGDPTNIINCVTFTTTVEVTQNSQDGVTITPTAGQIFTGRLGSIPNFWDDPMIPDDVHMNVSWGDGRESTVTLVANDQNGYDVYGSHTYANPGTYRIQVQISEAPSWTTHPIPGAVYPMFVLGLGGPDSTAVVTAPSFTNPVPNGPPPISPVGPITAPPVTLPVTVPPTPVSVSPIDPIATPPVISPVVTAPGPVVTVPDRQLPLPVPVIPSVNSQIASAPTPPVVAVDSIAAIDQVTPLTTAPAVDATVASPAPPVTIPEQPAAAPAPDAPLNNAPTSVNSPGALSLLGDVLSGDVLADPNID